jgi:predicted dehydrogenase
MNPSQPIEGGTTVQAPLRLALVGCGAVARRYHLPALLIASDIDVVAFVDRFVDRAKSLVESTGKGVALSTLSDLQGHVDLAVVATSNESHEAVAVDLLRQGIHVLVEKPMARSRVECDRMLAAADASGCLLAVGHDFRFFPVACFAHHLFSSEILGRVTAVEVHQSAGTKWPCLSAAALTPESGGGVLLGFGVHTLDLLLWWLGDMVPLAYRDDARGGVEAECECEFALHGGARVCVELSRRRALRDTAIVQCQHGTVEIGVFEPALVKVSVGQHDRVLAGTVSDPIFEQTPLRTVFARQLCDFTRAIRARRSPLVDGVDGRRVVALIEECYAMRRPLRRSWDFPDAYANLPTAR